MPENRSPVTPDTRHLTASMVVIDPGTEKALLVFHNATGKWVFPGGHVDPDEAPDEAALREVLEETGVRAAISGLPEIELPGMTRRPTPWLVAEIPAPPKPDRPGKPAEPAHSHIDLLYVGTADSAAPTTALLNEVASVRWVAVDAVWAMDIRAEVPTVAGAARDWLAAHRRAALHAPVCARCGHGANQHPPTGGCFGKNGEGCTVCTVPGAVDTCIHLMPDKSRCGRRVVYVPEGRGVISGWRHAEDEGTDHHGVPARLVR